VSLLKKLSRPPWRTIVGGFLLLAVFFGSYAAWQPGKDIRDGRHDLGKNGIWLGHGWLGADQWFVENGKTNDFNTFREPAHIHALAEMLRKNHIKDVFPHLCPSDPYGKLPEVDAPQAERFLAEFHDFRVIPWIGGPSGPTARFGDAKWRGGFIEGITNLLAAHPGFAGIQINIEPLTSGDMDFLKLLEEIHAALPKGKLLSVAAYPPPTRWQPFADVHWDEKYFRDVARRCDQMSVMMYDTSVHVPKIYEHVMSDWTSEVISWSDGKPVLLGIPTYDDAEAGYHSPKVENLRTALLGIHKALAASPLPPSYQGVAIYCEWETDTNEWSYFQEHFLKK
jgi:hypothetical protein